MVHGSYQTNFAESLDCYKCIVRYCPKKKTLRSRITLFIIVKQGPKKVLAERLASSDIIRGGNKKVILHILGPA